MHTPPRHYGPTQSAPRHSSVHESATYVTILRLRRRKAAVWLAIPALLSLGVIGASSPVSARVNGTDSIVIADDSQPVELGVRVTANADGRVNGVRFYKGAGNTGTHVGNVWDTSGHRLATITFTGKSVSGWQTMKLSKSVPLLKGQSLVVSYFAPRGHYAFQAYAFTQSQAMSGGALTATRGVFKYSRTSAYPSESWHDSSYYVEPVWSSTAPTPTTTTPAPTTTTTTPAPTTTTTTPAPTTTTTTPPTIGFPTEASTGWQHTGTTLTVYTGPLTITASNTVIDGKDIKGCLHIAANNVTIRNSRITCAGATATSGGTMIVQQSDAYTPGLTGLTMTDVEVTRPAGSTGGADYAILLYGSDVKLTRVKITNVTSGIHFSGGAVTVQDSFIGGLKNISGQDHNDAVIANGGASNVTLLHNTLEVPLGQTTPIAMYPEGEPNSYWNIEGNLLNGGGYCIYPSYTKGSEQPNHHITVTGNTFGKAYFSGCGAGGPVDNGVNGASFFDGASNTWTNNVWSDTGALVPVR